jgi:predicted DNA-binding transcriptional regulator YafY
VTYQSLSRPDPSERVIEPHALAFDGFRWHARAYCCKDGVFKDFLLSRILSVGETAARVSDPAEDHVWREIVTLEIGPHPELSDTQKRVFAMDYGMVDGVAEIPVRRALLYYALKRLGLDTDPGARRPQDQQIVLLNRDAVMQQ